MMTRKFPADILYYNILAEAYLKNGKNTEAIQLFDDVVLKDERNNNIGVLEDILHRAFCNECHKPIRGVRVKCIDGSCGYRDRCIRCATCPNQRTHSLYPCARHCYIHIPSQERFAAHGVLRQIRT